MRIFVTGQNNKRHVNQDEEEGPSRKNQRLDSNFEPLSFECAAGSGRKQKIRDYIEKCKRREVEPAKIDWDEERFFKRNCKENDPNRHILEHCTCRMSQVLGPNNKLSGKIFFLQTEKPVIINDMS